MRLLASLILMGWATASAVAQTVPIGEPVEGPPEAGVWFASFEGAKALVVGGQHFPGPRAVLPVADPEGVRAVGGEEAPTVLWNPAPAPLFLDTTRVSQPALSPGGKQSFTLWLEVWNATPESVPLLFVVTGGTGPFARKRSPLTTAVLPWSCARVPVEVELKEGSSLPHEEVVPLYVSVGGTPGEEPTVQFVDLYLHGEAIGPEPPRASEERVPLSPLEGVTIRVEQTFTGGPRSSTGAAAKLDKQELELDLSDDLRLVRVDLSPAAEIELVRVRGTEVGFTRDQLGHRFWLQREHEEAEWQAGLFPPPARHKHFGRPGGIDSLLNQQAVFVIGLGGSEALLSRRIQRARLEAHSWLLRTGRSPMVLFEDQWERARSFSDFRDRLLVLFGNKDDFAAWATLVGEGFVLRDRPAWIAAVTNEVLSEPTISAASRVGEAALAIAAAPRKDDPRASLLLMMDSEAACVLHPFDFVLSDFTDGADAIVNWGSGMRLRLDHRWLLPGTPEAGEEQR